MAQHTAKVNYEEVKKLFSLFLPGRVLKKIMLTHMVNCQNEKANKLVYKAEIVSQNTELVYRIPVQPLFVVMPKLRCIPNLLLPLVPCLIDGEWGPNWVNFCITVVQYLAAFTSTGL